eukprot:4414310-Prymnesium_polylepis.1
MWVYLSVVSPGEVWCLWTVTVVSRVCGQPPCRGSTCACGSASIGRLERRPGRLGCGVWGYGPWPYGPAEGSVLLLPFPFSVGSPSAIRSYHELSVPVGLSPPAETLIPTSHSCE